MRNVFSIVPSMLLVLAFSLGYFGRWDHVAAQGNVSPGVGVGASIHVEQVPSHVDDARGLFGRALGTRFWAAKVICGEIAPSGSPEQGTPLAPGSYRTTINVLNNQDQHDVFYFINVHEASPPGQPARSGQHSILIPALNAVSFDCNYVRSLLEPGATGFLEAFIRFDVARGDSGDPGNNEVVAVYTMKNVEGLPNQPLPNQ